MAYYLVQVSYNAAGVKAMVEHPQNRADAVRKGVESLGGKMHAFYFAFGSSDVVVINEMPDNVSAAAVAMGASGMCAKIETTVLMTPAESIEAMKKAKTVSYVPPQ
jgi:uncharacterized protein with GYD domain